MYIMSVASSRQFFGSATSKAIRLPIRDLDTAAPETHTLGPSPKYKP